MAKTSIQQINDFMSSLPVRIIEYHYPSHIIQFSGTFKRFEHNASVFSKQSRSDSLAGILQRPFKKLAFGGRVCL
jgi:hypothetical protein